MRDFECDPQVYSDDEQDQDEASECEEESQEGDHEQDQDEASETKEGIRDSDNEDSEQDHASDSDFVDSRAHARRAPIHQAQPSNPPQLDFYNYESSMTDEQKRAQDEQKFATAQKLEKLSKWELRKKRAIRFDSKGNLEYNDDLNQKESQWQRAVFHHWIRDELAEVANQQGSYAFHRLSGSAKGDATCFLQSQQAWGTSRSNYAPIMFRYEPPQSRQRVAANRWYHNERLVIDYWLRPLFERPEIPDVLSSEFEGCYMEPIVRSNIDIQHLDFRQRMPPFIRKRFQLRPVWSANFLAKKMRMFRYKAGAIAWNQRRGSEEVKAFIDKIHARQQPGRIGNDTHGCQDLTNAQFLRLLKMGEGSKAKGQGSKARGKGKKRGRSKKTAAPELGAATASNRSKRGKAAVGKGHYAYQEYDDLDEDYDTHQEDSDLVEDHDSNQEDDVPAEDQESSDSDYVDFNDRLYLVPETEEEIDFFEELITPTLRHYYILTGFNISHYNNHASYIEQYMEIETAMRNARELSGRRPERLLGLGEFNEQRGVWNLPWSFESFGNPPDFGSEVAEQVDDDGRVWQEGRWVERD